MTFDAANRLLTFNGQRVTYDADGNMVSGPLPATGAMGNYTYDSRNRLTGAGGFAYRYNAEGNRVGLTSTNETTTLTVDPQGALPKVLERVKNGVRTRYVYGAGLQYEVNDPGAATYYHYDQSGNTAALTNQAGAIIERVVYSPYGTIRYRQSNFDTPFLYGGFFGVMTDANGLINMRARYYNPLTMRFLNSDPAMDGLNWYAYASGNPISNSDPTGLETWQPSQSYQNQIRGNTEVMQLLQDRHSYVEDVSMANDVDSDFVRAIIIHESRGFGDRFQRLEAQVSWIRNGTAGSYGYAQLGPDARRASNLSIEEAQRMRGSISGAARWLSVSQTNLVNRGVSNPSVAQVASQYNYARQDGLVSNYGRQVDWTHSQIQSGSIGSFHKTSSTPKK
jgi:RHS repeat-associated protein